MPWRAVQSPAMVEGLRSLMVMGAAVLLALFWRLLAAPFLRSLAARTRTELDTRLLDSLRRPIVIAILLGGAYLSLARLSVWTERQMTVLDRSAAVAAVFVLIWSLLRAFNCAADWYIEAAAGTSPRPREVQAYGVVGRKVVNIVLLAVGILIVLREVGIEIAPMLAGLGIGGLAIALALQDTLSNLFAGMYMMVDRPVAVGDFIKLESGEEGFVEEIGWRNTKVRMWANNIVIIPNGKLSQSVLTNYYLPEQELSVYIRCGVAYDSDLEHVERVCVEVGQEVMARVPGSAPDWTPAVRYKEFSDFSINFIVVLRVKDFAAQYLLGHEYMKALHRRFGEEGIEIPFPIRTVIMRSPTEGQGAARRDG